MLLSLFWGRSEFNFKHIVFEAPIKHPEETFFEGVEHQDGPVKWEKLMTRLIRSSSQCKKSENKSFQQDQCLKGQAEQMFFELTVIFLEKTERFNENQEQLAFQKISREGYFKKKGGRQRKINQIRTENYLLD